MKSLIILLLVLCVQGELEGESCVTKHDRSPGICKHFRKCRKARADYDRGISLTICADFGGAPVICCPIETQTTLSISSKRISELKCEEYAELTIERTFSTDKPSITTSNCEYENPLNVGFKKTKNREFPHMAALGWEEPDEPIAFLCVGSLISENFVLTAAHCIKGGSPPTIVRLGAQNINSKADGLTELDVPVAEFISHEKFRKSSKYFNIALIRLSRNVDFTKFIRPACLWQTSNINYTKTIATGYGKTEVDTLKTENSDELTRITLEIINNTQCNTFFEGMELDRGIVDSQMCAGVPKELKDLCTHNSGGPTQIATPSNICLFHIIGIASFGLRCKHDNNSPTVYTRVSSYLDWIEPRVWGDHHSN